MIRFTEKIVGFALKNSTLVLFLTALLAVGGIYAYFQTPIEAYPDVTSTRTRIISQWPGRSAEEVEKFVTLPITKEVNSIPGKTSVRSISLFGLSVVTINFTDEIDDFYAQQYTSNRLNGVDFPDGVEAEIEPPSGATGEIFRYIIRAPKDMPIREVYALQTWEIERELLSVKGVADVVSFGGEEKAYQIRVNPAELANFGLTALDVFEAVSNSNVNVGGDMIEQGSQAYVVRGIGLLDKVSDIENILIKNTKDAPVLIKHVAEVSIGAKPRLGQVGFQDDEDVVEGIVLMFRGENPSAVVEGLKSKIEELNSRILPEGVSIERFHDRSTLVNKTVETVSKNLIEGIFLVSVVVFLFLFNWRTTLIVASVIPLAFLFAIILLRVQGLSANLISLGAVDFGLLLEGTMVIVEHVFVALDQKARSLGMQRFNRIGKSGIIRRNAKGVAKSILFAQLILIVALLPIFTFEKVEGKMFSPLAFTLGYALLGSLILSLTYVPVLCKILLNKNVTDRRNPITEGVRKSLFFIYRIAEQHKKAVLVAFAVLMLACGFGFSRIGTEFIPKLNEGAIYIRATLPNSISLEESVRLTNTFKKHIRSFDEVEFVLSQTGRPNDGTDPVGFFNIEFHTQLKDQELWERNISKDQLIEEMQGKLNQYPGTVFAFSQPIMDNVEEYVAGVKSALVVKIFGDNLNNLEQYADSVARQLKSVRGVEDLNIFRNMGIPELRIRLSEERMARYGVPVRDAQSVVEMAIGGKAASTYYEGERMFDIRVRYDSPFRSNEQQIRNILVPAMNDSKVPLYEIADIGFYSGPAFIYREGSSRYIAIGFSIRGRDLGSTVREAQERVQENISLPTAYKVEWAGEFENQERALSRLSAIVPISLLLIGFLLYLNFGNLPDTLLSLLTIPFAFIGGFLSLWITGTTFGISAGIGFIILFGVGTIDGIILISVMKEYLRKGLALEDAIRKGVWERIRPVFMIAIMGSLGLLPAALSQGMGAEIQKPLAIMIVGGLLICMLLSLVVLPQVFYLVYRNRPHAGKA